MNTANFVKLKLPENERLVGRWRTENELWHPGDFYEGRKVIKVTPCPFPGGVNSLVFLWLG